MSYGEVTDKKEKKWSAILIMEKTYEHKALHS